MDEFLDENLALYFSLCELQSKVSIHKIPDDADHSVDSGLESERVSKIFDKLLTSLKAEPCPVDFGLRCLSFLTQVLSSPKIPHLPSKTIVQLVRHVMDIRSISSNSPHLQYTVHKLLSGLLMSADDIVSPENLQNGLLLAEKVAVLEIACRTSGTSRRAILQLSVGQYLTQSLQCLDMELFTRTLEVVSGLDDKNVLADAFARSEFQSICLTPLSTGPPTELLNVLNNLLDYGQYCTTLSTVVPGWCSSLAEWILKVHHNMMAVAACANFAGSPNLDSCLCHSRWINLALYTKAVTLSLRDDADRRSTSYKEWQNLLLEMKASCEKHRHVSFPDFICGVFGGDDGQLCEMLLCLLHFSMLDCLPLPAPGEFFDALLTLLADDHFVLVSWISDNQNCFLAYLLQYLRLCTVGSINARQTDLFKLLIVSLESLRKNGGIIFNISPLICRLNGVLSKDTE